MAQLVKNVRNKYKVEFDQGKFDSWCVYLTRPYSSRYPPLDTEYFTRLKQIGEKHGRLKIYEDFIKVYNFTSSVLSPKILEGITRLADGYDTDAEEMDLWLTVIYAGMVAEENKANTVLKKRIKRLGMHQILVEDLAPEYAASFSKGLKWRFLDEFMKERGF